MKRILLGLVTLVSALGIGAWTTQAVWTDTVTVTNNVITTGTVDLQVSTNHGTTWDTSTASSTMVISNLVPGGSQTGLYSFSLRNMGTVPLNLTGIINPLAVIVDNTPAVDRTQLMIQLYDEGTGLPASGEFSLADWEALARSITPSLSASITRHYEIRARLLSTANNDWQGQTVTFTLEVTGTQP